MKTVVVTGATRGLGLAITTELIAKGFSVVGTGRKPTNELSELIDRSDRRASFIPFDLQDIAGIPALIRSIAKEHGGIYGLVNNAGIGLDGVLATQHSTDIARLLTVNLEAAITLSKFASRQMLTNRSGRIVNISSIIAQTGFNGLAVYGATKAGLEGFTRSLSRELGRGGITVNCVAPGYMETQMTGGLDDGKMDSIRRRAPLGLPQVEDAAHAAAYLLSDEAAKITGTVLTVDGGSTA